MLYDISLVEEFIRQDMHYSLFGLTQKNNNFKLKTKGKGSLLLIFNFLKIIFNLLKVIFILVRYFLIYF